MWKADVDELQPRDGAIGEKPLIVDGPSADEPKPYLAVPFLGGLDALTPVRGKRPRPPRSLTRVYVMAVMRIESRQAERVRSKDRLEALYSSQGAAAIRLAYVLTGDRHAAQDIAHEAFVKIGRKILGLRDPDHERAYLFRTVVNLCRGQARKFRTERAALERLQREDRPSAQSSSDDPTWQAVLDLPARQRAALYLRYYQDLSEAQTAETLECSVSAVKSLVNRALNQLRLTTTRSGS